MTSVQEVIGYLGAEPTPRRRPYRLPRIGGWATALAQRSVAVATLLAAWEALPRLGVVDETFLPPLSQVLRAWWALAADGELAQHVEASMIRSLSGFGLAIVLAIPLGLLIGWYRPLATVLRCGSPTPRPAR